MFAPSECGKSDDGSLVCSLLPWGTCIWIKPNDVIGRKIMRLGLFDLSVCELIARLVQPGDTVLDVGANCGQMTSLMAVCAGPSGRVMSFEPHPVNFDLLAKNVAQWTDGAEIVASDTALGDVPGTAQLGEPEDFEENTGLSSLASGRMSGRSFEVMVDTLDNVLSGVESVRLMKMDVEGFEANVLRGASESLKDGRIRNIVYEDHEGHPSDVSRILEENGYTILTPVTGILGPKLHVAGKVAQTNFLATLENEKAEAVFHNLGYLCLKKR